MTQEFVTLPREVVEQALEALWTSATPKAEEAIAALRAALEQPQGEQEPVAWISPSALEWSTRESEKVVKLTRKAQPEYDFTEPLYTHPQPAQKPLTDDQVLKAVRHLYQSDLPVGMGFSDDLDVARAIEAAHNIK